MQDKTIKKILAAWETGVISQYSDDSIQDFADENNLRFDDVLACLANHAEGFEKCYGCEHITDRCYMAVYSPCQNCSRYRTVQDNYVKSNKRFRTKKDDEELLKEDSKNGRNNN